MERKPCKQKWERDGPFKKGTKIKIIGNDIHPVSKQYKGLRGVIVSNTIFGIYVVLDVNPGKRIKFEECDFEKITLLKSN